MEHLILHEKPEPRLPTMIVAFAGWPDAAESATRAVRYLARKLTAKKFAEIDPEEFYDFTLVRPQTRINRQGQRIIRWPTNDFYYWAEEDGSHGLLLYVGTEPSLKWRTFSKILVDVAEQCGVTLVISLGALLDAMPHTREPRVNGRASSEELRQKAEWLGIQPSTYQGPTGIHTAFMDACSRRGMPYATVWGHSPHYVQTTPNPKVSHALLTKLRQIVDIEVDLEELRLAGEAFEEEINKLISKEPEIRAYVKRLEQHYDAAQASPEEIPSPETMVKELEDFLRRQRENPGQNPEGGGAS